MAGNSLMAVQGGDFLGDYDFSRTDRFFSLKIPSVHMEGGVVFYQISLKDLIRGEVHSCRYRFKEIKAAHESLSKLEFQLPPFPKTHFWSKTNSNPELIEKRRNQLENYLSHVINDPYLRGYREVKRIISMCKQEKPLARRYSFCEESTEGSSKRRSLSGEKYVGQVMGREEWMQLQRERALAS